MKTYRNHLLASSIVVLVVVSSLLSAPRPTRAPAGSSFGTTISAVTVEPPAARSPFNVRRVAGAKPSLPAAAAAQSDRAEDLSVDASFGNEQISLERKKRRSTSCCHVVIQIIAVLVGRPSDGDGPPMVDLRAEVIGPDAVRGSLLYGLVWLAGDADPLRSVRALGYDIEVSKEHERPCTAGPRSQVCVERARRLATLVDATLGLSDASERVQFRLDAAALGIPPDCVAGATQMTSTVLSAASPDRSEDLSMDASFGDEQISIERKRRATFHDFQFTHHVDKSSPVLATRVTGPDAGQGGLLYALAWLAGNPDPLGAVRALGYDLEVRTLYERPCTDQLPGQTCVELTRQFATLIDATLGLGNLEERARFRQDAAKLGAAPDCSTREP
jgi:hypothetical protein